MKSPILLLPAVVFIFSAMSASAAIRYVNVNSVSPAPPYTNWTTAAESIQDAVDAAGAGDQILVTNGVYQTGGRVVFGAMKNRVVVDKPVTVQSVNGAAVTLIQGAQVMRCVYLTSGAALMGFTLTKGRSSDGGGVFCESVTAVLYHSVLTGNSADSGGGASSGTLYNCTLTGNSAGNVGGGAFDSALNNCTLSGNSAGSQGGGAWVSTLNDCTLNANSATDSGGGAAYSTLNNCALTGNSAIGDSVNGSGGGAERCTLNHCTLTGNFASREGGGAIGGTLNNCIVYYNSAPNGDNYLDCSLSYSCTTPLAPEGAGNISAEPQLADLSHIGPGSPCRGAGVAAYSTGPDVDGESWANPPSIGCDEYQPATVTGPLGVTIQAAYTNVAVGFTVNFTAAMDGRATANRWEFGDGTMVSNQPYASHSWAVAGDYLVGFRAYNDTYPDGVSATVTVQVVAQPVHYVALGSAKPVAPYTSWATAANNIQDAVDAASLAGALVLVTNGVYRTGGREVPEELVATPFNRVAVTKPLVLRSVNGASVTVIDREHSTGDQSAGRCVYLADGAALVGFTLTHGLAYSGGGVWCESRGAVVSDCVLTGNSAGGDGPSGGGAYRGTLNNCALTGNSVFYFGQGGAGAASSTLNNCVLTGNIAGIDRSGGRGGGALNCTLNNCTLTGNTAYIGGGVSGCTLNNCIVYDNSAPIGPNYDSTILNYSCTTPLPTNGIGNLTSAPLFVSQAAGSLRLQSNSPCINAGSNAYASAGPDFDGNPRVAGGKVDIGAYEFQAPPSVISYAWLQEYGLSTDGSADYTDTDGDGLNNWQEWRAGTDPTNALSALRLLSAVPGPQGVIVRWQSVSSLNYFLERGTNLGAQPPFLPLANNIAGQPGTTPFTDSTAVGAGPYFYRVGVQE